MSFFRIPRFPTYLGSLLRTSLWSRHILHTTLILPVFWRSFSSFPSAVVLLPVKSSWESVGVREKREMRLFLLKETIPPKKDVDFTKWSDKRGRWDFLILCSAWDCDHVRVFFICRLGGRREEKTFLVVCDVPACVLDVNKVDFFFWLLFRFLRKIREGKNEDKKDDSCQNLSFFCNMFLFRNDSKSFSGGDHRDDHHLLSQSSCQKRVPLSQHEEEKMRTMKRAVILQDIWRYLKICEGEGELESLSLLACLSGKRTSSSLWWMNWWETSPLSLVKSVPVWLMWCLNYWTMILTDGRDDNKRELRRKNRAVSYLSNTPCFLSVFHSLLCFISLMFRLEKDWRESLLLMKSTHFLTVCIVPPKNLQTSFPLMDVWRRWWKHQINEISSSFWEECHSPSSLRLKNNEWNEEINRKS